MVFYLSSVKCILFQLAVISIVECLVLNSRVTQCYCVGTAKIMHPAYILNELLLLLLCAKRLIPPFITRPPLAVCVCICFGSPTTISAVVIVLSLVAAPESVYGLLKKASKNSGYGRFLHPSSSPRHLPLIMFSSRHLLVLVQPRNIILARKPS